MSLCADIKSEPTLTSETSLRPYHERPFLSRMPAYHWKTPWKTPFTYIPFTFPKTNPNPPIAMQGGAQGEINTLNNQLSIPRERLFMLLPNHPRGGKREVTYLPMKISISDQMFALPRVFRPFVS
jgi:hypothetical protein